MAVVLVSGIGPGHLGVGRVMEYLERRSTRLRFAFKSRRRREARALLRNGHLLAVAREAAGIVMQRLAFQRDCAAIDPQDTVILVHPQTLGLPWCTRFISRHQGPVFLWAMDSAVFCRSSYNHVRGENRACLRCVGGTFAQADAQGCSTYPYPRRGYTPFARAMIDFARSGKIGFLVQNHGSCEVFLRHFGPGIRTAIVPIWAVDWDDQPTVERAIGTRSWDVVFHAASEPAKGFRWAIEVAAHAPSLRFLFPDPPPAGERPPENCDFIRMRWSTGLAEALASCRLALAPSLWSAPIEGALIKSIRIARATAVADEPTAYARELPERLVLRLPLDPPAAAQAITRALADGWRPDEAVKAAWLDDIAPWRDVEENLLRAISNR